MRNIADTGFNTSRNIEELRGRKDPAAIKAVAREMESLFAYEMIKVMRETVAKSSKDSLGAETYMSMFDMELSKLFAERGLGLQDMFSRGLNAVADRTGAARNKRDENKVGPLLLDRDHVGISSGYGLRRDPQSGAVRFHEGLDVPAPEGTEIHAVRAGSVLFSGEQAGYGNVVVIDHGDGFISKYAHNESNLVQTGETVAAGSVIAQVGTTGKSTGSHVHFEVQYHGDRVDPAALLSQG